MKSRMNPRAIWACKTCDYRLGSRIRLLQHLKDEVHLPKIRECCICHRVLDRPGDTRRHLKEAHGWVWPVNIPLPITTDQLQDRGWEEPEPHCVLTPAGAKRLSILNNRQPGKDRRVALRPDFERDISMTVTVEQIVRRKSYFELEEDETWDSRPFGRPLLEYDESGTELLWSLYPFEG